MLTRAFLASSFWISTRYGFTAIFGIATTYAFAHLAEKETFGQYQFVLSVLSLFSIFTLPGLNMAALKAVSQKRPGAILEATKRSFITSLYAVPILVAYGIYLLLSSATELGLTIILSSLLFPFFYAPNTWYTYFEGRSDFRPVVIRTVIASFTVTMALIVSLYFKIPLLGLVGLYLGISAAFSILYFSLIRRWLLTSKTPPRSEDLDTGYGKRVTIQKFVYTLSETLPPLAVSFLLGHASLAAFQVANIFLAGMSGLISSLAIISLPKIFADTNSTHRTLFWQNALTGMVASVGYFVAVRIIFMPMYGESYLDSFLLAQVAAGLPFIVSLRTFFVNYYTARDSNSLIICTYIAANAVALILFVLADWQGSFVVATATYLYSLHALLLLPLATRYFTTTKREPVTSPATA